MLRNLLAVFQDQFIRDADDLLMQCRIHALQIIQEQVRIRQHLLDNLPLHKSGRIHRGMHPGLFALLQKFQREGRLAQTLAAGDCHTAARFLKERLIPFQPVHDFLHRLIRPAHIKRGGLAGMCARAAVIADCLIHLRIAYWRAGKIRRFLPHRDGSFRTNRKTLAAGLCPQTPVAHPVQFRPESHSLRAVAPWTVQRASLQKYRRADSRSILDRKPLNII